MNWISALTKEPLVSFLFPPTMSGCGKKFLICEPERELSKHTESANTLILALQLAELGETDWYCSRTT